MNLKGTLEDVIFQNEVNGYTIATFQTEEEVVTVVGYLPFINPKDSLKLEGDYVEHPEYGRQFKIATFEKLMPETEERIRTILVPEALSKGLGRN